MDQELESLKQFNREIRQALLDDGSDPDGLYVLEHHFSADDFNLLEAAAVAAFKAGYEVTDAEQVEDEEGNNLFSFDVVNEQPLDLAVLDEECKTMLENAEKWGIYYDGWGTYFVDPDGTEEPEQES
ncbi:ribonuclease E inhibitor RraB [Neiella sp. HB171785]|uniref:Regulator of ribonuclease activity B n=1 Tax=Neiella litorisoli TaxID=2771431 RepID=A0A8J6UE21_9GAMM|nr:ribonuclease E inhibitor RraB [Neiella litorisoli]MBD1389084.1 ribonuclease E inhibitor RraB [Neiella litorisoli]